MKHTTFQLLTKSTATKHLLRKEHSTDMQALVIFLRFGRLTTDEHPWLSPKEVWVRTGVKACTQHQMIRRWRDQGFTVMKTKRLGIKETLDKEQIEWLTSLETLQSMSHLSLKQRAQVIQERLQLPKFHFTMLRRYYVHYKVKYKRPDYKFWKSSADIDDLRGKQKLFVQELGQLLINKEYDEILYLDETTCNLWQKVSKCWLKPGMKLPLLKTRGHSITVIGAISAERGLVHVEVMAESNNGETFRNFMLALKAKCVGRKVLIIQDNLRIHHAKVLHDMYSR